MQLKKQEPIDNGENTEGVAGAGGSNGMQPETSQQQDDQLSNNAYFNPEQEFDFEGDGIFDTPKTSFDNSVNDPSAAGVQNGMYDNGMPGAGSGYYAAGGTSNAPEPGMGERPRKLTKKEFFDSPRNRKDRDRIIISSIVIIVAAIFDVIRTDFWISALQRQIDMVNSLAEEFGMAEQVIDTAAIMRGQVIVSVILIILGLGIFILKSRACAIGGLAFTLINTLYTIVTAHNFRWYWTIIAFGYAVVATVSFANSWKEYEENGDWKREW